jgi:AcrR family transcriptional regulator
MHRKKRSRAEVVAEAAGADSPAGDRNQPRQPRQRRGVERFEAILDAAHDLLVEHVMADISLYDVARVVGCAPATVYHLFPSTNALFFALAERYAKAWFEILERNEDPAAVRTWHDLARRKFAEARTFYNANPQAMQVYLGLGTTREIRVRDQELNRQLGAEITAAIRRQFQLQQGDYLDEKFAYAIEISDAFWSLSYARHGRITTEFAEEALLAVFSYLENFIPSQLPRLATGRPQPAAADGGARRFPKDSCSSK